MGRELCAQCLQSFEESALTAVGDKLLCPACQRQALKPAGTSSARIVAAGAEPEAPAGPAPFLSPARVKLFMGLGAGAAVMLAVVVGLIVFLFSMGNPLTERVDEFFKLGTSGRCAQAYRDCTTAGFKQKFSLEDTERRMTGGGGYLRARMSGFKITGNQATWQGALMFVNGRSVPTVVLLEKVGGQWRIAAINN